MHAKSGSQKRINLREENIAISGLDMVLQLSGHSQKTTCGGEVLADVRVCGKVVLAGSDFGKIIFAPLRQ